MLRNQVNGNGYVRPAGGNFGIGLLGGGDNTVEDNVVTGNVTGVRIVAASVGNVFRSNLITGNPPILISNDSPENAELGFDILNLSAPGANTFEGNVCITTVNAPCGNGKSTSGILPRVTGVTIDAPRVRQGGLFSATFSGSNLAGTTHFDVRFRSPGAASDFEAWNWQIGPTSSHPVPQNAALGDWTITGVRAHSDPADHTGPYNSVRANIIVTSLP